jgi:ribosomal protein S4
MRLTNRYKYYDRCFFLVRSFPYKILAKFRRPKWKKIQQFLKKSKRIFFYNRSVIKTSFKTWERLQLLYKESLNLKTSIILSHDQAFNLKFYKKNFTKSYKNSIEIISQNLVKPFFSLRLLLYILRFAESSYLSKQMLSCGKVWVNSKKNFADKILNKGDVILVKDFKGINKINTALTFNYSFIEVDYYSGVFTILKSLDEFSFNDLSTLLKENIDFKKFLYYVKKN